MKLTKKLCILSCLFGLLGMVTACGSDDDKGGGAAKLESCKQLCDKQAAANCPLNLGADVCKQFCDAFAQAPAACQDASKAASDCQLAQADVCATDACKSQEMAVENACK